MEVVTGYAKYQLEPVEYNNKTYDASSWKNATSPESAAEAFIYIFKKPDTVLSDEELNQIKEKAGTYYTNFKGKTITDIQINQTQLNIVNIAKNSSKYGIYAKKGFCLGWVNDVYTQAGAKVERKCCAYCSGYYFGVSKDFSIIPIGAAVYGKSSTEAGKIYGHVGIYIGNGQVIDNIGYARLISLEKWRAENPDGCWGWTSSTPVNSNWPVVKGNINAGRH